LKLYVNKNVLVPRPETEELVEWILADNKAAGMDVFEKERGEADKTRSLKILDVGTGSGCIALALKKAMPKAEVWGCEWSDAALNVARRNGAALDIRVDFQYVNFLDATQWSSLPAMDIVVSNPPYIAQSERNTMPLNVVQHEPHVALFVPDENPLVFYEALAGFGKEKLHEHGMVYAEVHEDYGQAVVQLFKNFMYSEVQLKKDMQGKDRMVKAARSCPW
jgi:release factor glutamine methyltransferase